MSKIVKAFAILAFLVSELYIFSLAYAWTSTHVPHGFLTGSSLIVLAGPAVMILASIFLYRKSDIFDSKQKDSKDK